MSHESGEFGEKFHYKASKAGKPRSSSRPSGRMATSSVSTGVRLRGLQPFVALGLIPHGTQKG